MTETCRQKLETVMVIYTFISAFVGVTYMRKSRGCSCGTPLEKVPL
jgi:hypothetical protein